MLSLSAKKFNGMMDSWSVRLLCLLLTAVLLLAITLPALAGDPLDTWSSRNLSQDSLSHIGGIFWEITYGKGTFVLVGEESESGTENKVAILTSPDGVTWTSRAPGTTNTLGGVTYGSGVFVAVGKDGVILTSPDGANWTSQTSGTTDYLHGAAYGSGTFVVIGASGTILTSPNGVNWTVQTLDTTNYLTAVAYGNGEFVAVGDSGTILTSLDGRHWTAQTSGTTSTLRAVACGNGTFVAVGHEGTILNSQDGVSWTSQASGTENLLMGVAYGSGTFVAVGGKGICTILSSSDGISWASSSKSGTGNALLGVAYGDGSFVAVGIGRAIYQSGSLTGPNPTLLPVAPTNLTAEADPDNSKIYLSWVNSSSNEDYFLIQRKAVGGEYADLAKTNAGSTSYTDDSGLTPGTGYYYKIKACSDTLEDSDYSVEASATTQGPKLLPSSGSTPTDLSASPASGSAIDLSWKDNSCNEDYFLIQRKTDGGEYIDLAKIDADVTFYTDDTGLNPGTTYYYRIKASSKKLGDSDYSNEALATSSVPAAPTDLDMTVTSRSAVKLSWTDKASNETGFIIERRIDAGSYIEIKVPANSTTYIDDTGFSTVTTYNYRIKAYNTFGYSEYSNDIFITMPLPVEPGQTIIRFCIGENDCYVNEQVDSMDTVPMIREGRTLLPVRYVAIPLGASVDWDSDDQKVKIVFNGKTIELWINQNTARIDGVDTPIDQDNPNVVPIVVPPGRTMLPLRFIAENLGCQVDWDPSLQEVKVTYPQP